MKNKLLPRRILIFILAITMTILPIGCRIATGTENNVTGTTSPQLQISETLVIQSTYTATVNTTPTRKPTATFPPTRTPLPPQTDLPTIEPNDINNMIDSLYSRCKLPCWGNIIPGKTSQYVAKRFLSPLGEWITGSESLGGVLFQYNNTSTSISLGLEYGLVNNIILSPEITKPYRINRLFTEYGMPEDIQLEILPLTAELTSWFWLVIKYPQQGFFAMFSAKGTVVNSIINICPRNISPELYLFEENKYSSSEMDKIISIDHPHSAYQPLNALTDMDINQFYEIFSRQDSACAATNVKFQLP